MMQSDSDWYIRSRVQYGRSCTRSVCTFYAVEWLKANGEIYEMRLGMVDVASSFWESYIMDHSFIT